MRPHTNTQTHTHKRARPRIYNTHITHTLRKPEIRKRRALLLTQRVVGKGGKGVAGRWREGLRSPSTVRISWPQLYAPVPAERELCALAPCGRTLRIRAVCRVGAMCPARRSLRKCKLMTRRWAYLKRLICNDFAYFEADSQAGRQFGFNLHAMWMKLGLAPYR